MNRIIAPTWEANDGDADNLIDVNCFLGNSISGAELSIDTLNSTLDDRQNSMTEFETAYGEQFETADDEKFYVIPWLVVSIRGKIEDTKYGDPIYYEKDGNLIGKFYFSSVDRIGVNKYRVSCISAIGLLENSKHYGGIYTGQKMDEVLADIIGGVIEYSVDPAFNNIRVYGWLPPASRRDNLRQLLFVEGACIKKDGNGNIQISYVSDETSIEIPDNRIFIGGEIEFTTPATKVIVNEHGYSALPTDEEKTLFEGTVAATSIITPSGEQVEGSIVLFDGPMHDLSVEGSTILESGVNYAVLGYSSNCKLKGKAYTHTIRQIVRPDNATMLRSGDLISFKDNEVTVENATLVSLVNSENVADRVYSYYGFAKTTKADILVENERPSTSVSFTDPFGEKTSGYIKSMDIRGSGILRASAEIIEGYVPPAIGDQYNTLKILSYENGTSFTIPDGVTRIRLVIIGAGNGGQSGEAGKKGGNAPWNNTLTGAEGGEGGKRGKGGNGGNIYIVSLSVLPWDVVSVYPGRGGVGGARSSGEANSGDIGNNTEVSVSRNGVTIATYSSASGSPSVVGYIDPLHGNVYAKPGKDGTDGCKGSGKSGKGPAYLSDTGSIMCNPGDDGYPSELTYPGQWTAEAMGGYGGGAARPRGSTGSGVYAGSGQNGETSVNNGYGFASGGDGGAGKDGQDGANLTYGDPTTYKFGPFGTGGIGGHGGGGGGGGGGGKHTDPSYSNGGSGGQGGEGGAGSAGCDGCCLLYF